MPRTPATWGGAAALWVTAAGWAGAEERRGGDPMLLTPSGLLDFEEALRSTSKSHSMTPGRVRRALPQWTRQLARDGQRATTMSRYRRSATTLLVGAQQPSGYVWQHHELFHSTGQTLRDAFEIPLIEYVHAPIVWEARRWGVRRPGSAALVERFGEVPQLQSADLVACVSDEVQREVLRFGINEDKTIVAPMGVDVERFSPTVDGGPWRETLRDLGDFVLVWAGSLRRFHHVELAVDAIVRLRREGCSVGLLVAGDGQDRARLEHVVVDQGVSRWVRFVGQIPATEMPSLLRNADAALVTGARGQEFHYSPLKLREYLAMELPVVVPRLGEIERMVDDGCTGLLYEAGDADALAEKVRRLVDDPILRRRIGEAGRSMVADSWTWDAISRRCLERLDLA